MSFDEQWTELAARAKQKTAQVHVNALLPQQALAEPAWASRFTDEYRRGLTALFWSNFNPCGTFRLEMDKPLELSLSAAVPVPRRVADAVGRKQDSEQCAHAPWVSGLTGDESTG